MWLGKGGWLQVRELDRQVEAQQEANARLKARNDALDADVRDLKTRLRGDRGARALGARHDSPGRGLLPASGRGVAGTCRVRAVLPTRRWCESFVRIVRCCARAVAGR